MAKKNPSSKSTKASTKSTNKVISKKAKPLAKKASEQVKKANETEVDKNSLSVISAKDKLLQKIAQDVIETCPIVGLMIKENTTRGTP